MRRAHSPLPPLMLLPLAVWACGAEPSAPQDAGMADAELDAGMPEFDAGMAELDAGITDATPCIYPEGAVEPMALDAVITPYRWPRALDGTNQAAELDLARAFCADDPVIDWAPFEVLLFVSAPAW